MIEIKIKITNKNIQRLDFIISKRDTIKQYAIVKIIFDYLT